MKAVLIDGARLTYTPEAWINLSRWYSGGAWTARATKAWLEANPGADEATFQEKVKELRVFTDRGGRLADEVYEFTIAWLLEAKVKALDDARYAHEALTTTPSKSIIYKAELELLIDAIELISDMLAKAEDI